jgi:hypothetical protein
MKTQIIDLYTNYFHFIFLHSANQSRSQNPQFFLPQVDRKIRNEKLNYFHGLDEIEIILLCLTIAKDVGN